MEFKSKFGIGEICGYNEDARRGDKTMEDILVKVSGITFEANGREIIHVEHIGRSFGVQRFAVGPETLNGDPDFDQSSGKYPDTED